MPKGREEKVVYVKKGEEAGETDQVNPDVKEGQDAKSPEGRGGNRQGRRKPREPRSEYREKRAEGESPEEPVEGKDETENPENKKNRKPRVIRAKPDDSWREDLKTSMTVETKIPAYPTKEELLSRPDNNKLRQELNAFDDEISDIEEQIREFKDERKIIKNQIRNQNKVEYEELNKLITSIKNVNIVMNTVQDKKKALVKERTLLEDKLSKLEKKAFNGKIMPEARLKEIIGELEAEYKNNRHTAIEEKKHIERLEKLKQSVPLAAEASVIHQQLKNNRDRQKEANEAANPVYARKKELQSQIEVVRQKLNSKKEKEQKKTAEEKEAEKEKRRTEWVESPEEKAIRQKEVEAVEKIKEIKRKKQEAKEALDKEFDAYHAQKLEMDKIEFMWDVMDGLKEEDKKRKAGEELAKRREEELKRVKQELGTKYTFELDVLDSLTSFLEQSKLEKKLRNQPLGGGDFGHKVDEEALKKDKLALIKSKKATSETEGAVQPGQKKAVKKVKGGKKEEEGKEGKEDEKEKEEVLELDLRTLDNFSRVKIEPPKGFEDFDRVAELIQKKRDEYVQRREDEIAGFEKNPPEVRLDRDDDDRRGVRRDRDERRGERGDRGERGPRRDREDRGDRGERGERGPRGDRGERGERGDRGDRGDRGERGERGPRRDREEGRDDRQEREAPKEDVPQEEVKPKAKNNKKVEYNYDTFPSIN